MTTEAPTLPPVTPPQLPPAPRRRRRPHWILWSLLIISLLVNFVTCSNIGDQMSGLGVEEFPVVDETLIWGSDAAEAKVAVLSLSGVIMRESSSSLFGEMLDPVTKILHEIRAVTVDPEVSAILLKVNSPGGGVTASDEIYQALMDFKASRPGRKIVVHVGDMAASGGYYIALAGDVIVAQPTSIVGSVGVIISAVNMHQLGEKLGIQDASLTSSDNKALLNSLEPVNPEHEKILQEVVDQMYGRFRGLVLKHRSFNGEFADEHQLLDGRIFTLPAAQDFGLVDETGYIDQSRKRVLSLLGVEEAGFYQIDFSEGGWSSLFSVKSPEILAPLQPNSQFQYLWKP